MYWVAAGGLAVLVILAVLSLQWPGNSMSGENSLSQQSTAIESQADGIATEPTNSVLEDETADQPMEELSTTLIETMSLESEPAMAAPSLESLLSSLHISRPPTKPSSTGSDDIAIDAITADEIVRQSLAQSHPTESRATELESDSPDSIEQGRSEPKTGGSLEDEDPTLASEPNSPDNESLSVTIDVRSGRIRETFRMGRRVSTKKSTLLGTFQVGQDADDSLVVQPVEPAEISGTGRSCWKIAFEDEEPELRVELFSKPAALWQIEARVSVKINSSTDPIPIGPGDAREIATRLGMLYQWLDQSIEALRNLPRTPTGRGPRFDIGGQIRAWQAQQKDTERAIKQWGVIARLANAVFTSGKIDAQLSAH
jgi:hypothetical protein